MESRGSSPSSKQHALVVFISLVNPNHKHSISPQSLQYFLTISTCVSKHILSLQTSRPVFPPQISDLLNSCYMPNQFRPVTLRLVNNTNYELPLYYTPYFSRHYFQTPPNLFFFPSTTPIQKIRLTYITVSKKVHILSWMLASVP